MWIWATLAAALARVSTAVARLSPAAVTHLRPLRQTNAIGASRGGGQLAPQDRMTENCDLRPALPVWLQHGRHSRPAPPAGALAEVEESPSPTAGVFFFDTLR